ncbi:hypothetical protein Tco_0006921 [Tanacetum coccineum]
MPRVNRVSAAASDPSTHHQPHVDRGHHSHHKRVGLVLFFIKHTRVRVVPSNDKGAFGFYRHQTGALVWCPDPQGVCFGGHPAVKVRLAVLNSHEGAGDTLREGEGRGSGGPPGVNGDVDVSVVVSTIRMGIWCSSDFMSCRGSASVIALGEQHRCIEPVRQTTPSVNQSRTGSEGSGGLRMSVVEWELTPILP